MIQYERYWKLNLYIYVHVLPTFYHYLKLLDNLFNKVINSPYITVTTGNFDVLL
jgi:hypothetical protein